MTNHERLMTALFGRDDREHIDIKFFAGSLVDTTDEEFCGQAADMIEQMDASDEADETFAESFEQRTVEQILAA